MRIQSLRKLLNQNHSSITRNVYFIKSINQYSFQQSMGIGKSKSAILKDHELDEFSKITAFSSEEINNLYTHFKAISVLERDDGVIDYEEWCEALETNKCLITQRLFNLLDENHDSVINFREFLLGISILIEDNIETQIRLTYKLFDPDNLGIKQEFLTEILEQASSNSPFFAMPKTVLHEIIQKTFEEAIKQNDEKDDKKTIDYHQYKRIIRDNPNILKWFYVDLEKVKQSAKFITKNPKKYGKVHKLKIPSQ